MSNRVRDTSLVSSLCTIYVGQFWHDITVATFIRQGEYVEGGGPGSLSCMTRDVIAFYRECGLKASNHSNTIWRQLT